MSKTIHGFLRRALALALVLCLCLAVLCSCHKKEAEDLTDDPAASSSPEATASSEPEESEKPEPVYESVMIGTVTNVSSFLNVRSGPGTDFDILGKAYNGDKFTVLLKFVDGGYWHKIEYGELVGYVHSDYLSITTELVEVTE